MCKSHEEPSVLAESGANVWLLMKMVLEKSVKIIRSYAITAGSVNGSVVHIILYT